LAIQKRNEELIKSYDPHMLYCFADYVDKMYCSPFVKLGLSWKYEDCSTSFSPKENVQQLEKELIFETLLKCNNN